jgi:membrane protein implicated in regulation of membrane protease activity
MNNLFVNSDTVPFGAALVLMLALAIIEGVGLFTAMSPSQWLDNLVPHTDPSDGIDGVEGTLGWLHVGRVPMLVLLILFLAGFAVCGYAVQLVARSIGGGYLPWWLASVPAVLMGVTTVRGVGALLAHIIPRDETSAVGEEALVGRAGVVTQGVARRGHPAEVKLRDHLGRAHYLRVEPDVEGEEFAEGTAVLVVKKTGAVYRAIHNPHPDLLK